MDTARLHTALLRLTPSEQDAILSAGYVHPTDFGAATPDQLAAACAIGPEVATRFLASLRDEAPPQAPAAAAAVDRPPCVLTCSKALDRALGGGVHTGRVTELVGLPGAGKTQVALQTCLSACLPPQLGGCGGRALFVDVEGSLSVARCRQVAEAMVATLKQTGLSARLHPDILALLRNLTADSLLNRVDVVRCVDLATLLATARTLDARIRSAAEGYAAVCVDSVAFAFRQDTGEYSKRVQLLSGLGLALQQVAARHRAAVIVLNQVTTGRDGTVAPALGPAWLHVPDTRVWLRAEGAPTSPVRHAEVSSSGAFGVVKGARAAFVLCAAGVRDVEEG
eukprot:Rhum_TRINITY_DN8346_c0_g1::Rhum_TRINITY_DN8346_c0_g1_i1::g.27417::m.27417/K10870/RAD51L2, RAD51C; RAD51-like protein 2